MMMVRRCALGHSDGRSFQVEIVMPGLDGQTVKSQRQHSKTRAKGVGERPFSRFAARENHARGLRRLRFPGVRADVPHGQEDPEKDGHESPLRLPKLPPTRAISGTPRRRRRPPSAPPRRASSGKCTTPCSRAEPTEKIRRRPTRRGGRPGPLPVPARDARARPLREDPGHPGGSRAQRSRVGAGLLHQLHPARELLRPGDAARGGPGGLAGVRPSSGDEIPTGIRVLDQASRRIGGFQC